MSAVIKAYGLKVKEIKHKDIFLEVFKNAIKKNHGQVIGELEYILQGHPIIISFDGERPIYNLDPYYITKWNDVLRNVEDEYLAMVLSNILKNKTGGKVGYEKVGNQYHIMCRAD